MNKVIWSLWVLCVLVFALTVAAVSPQDNGTADDRIWYEKKLLTHETGSFAGTKIHILRLQPGEDLRDSLTRYAHVTGIKAASLVTCVGSLTEANIRLANDESGTLFTGHFEIVSLVGMVDFQHVHEPGYKGDGHVHISISDGAGKTIGGHLLSGSKIYTTAEISLLEIEGARFQRVPDLGPNGSGYMELKVFDEASNPAKSA